MDSEVYDFNNEVQIDFPRPAREIEINIIRNNNNNGKEFNNKYKFFDDSEPVKGIDQIIDLWIRY